MVSSPRSTKATGWHFPFFSGIGSEVGENFVWYSVVVVLDIIINAVDHPLDDISMRTGRPLRWFKEIIHISFLEAVLSPGKHYPMHYQRRRKEYTFVNCSVKFG